MVFSPVCGHLGCVAFVVDECTEDDYFLTHLNLVGRGEFGTIQIQTAEYGELAGFLAVV